jgi:hypothetical protein
VPWQFEVMQVLPVSLVGCGVCWGFIIEWVVIVWHLAVHEVPEVFVSTAGFSWQSPQDETYCGFSLPGPA